MHGGGQENIDKSKRVGGTKEEYNRSENRKKGK